MAMPPTLKIYNEEVRDLLAVSGAGEKRDKLELKEDPNKGVYVKVDPFAHSRLALESCLC